MSNDLCVCIFVSPTFQSIACNELLNVSFYLTRLSLSLRGAADRPVLLAADPGPQELDDLLLPQLVTRLLGLQQDARQLLAAPERLTGLSRLALAWSEKQVCPLIFTC